jgi:hypothetical protein
MIYTSKSGTKTATNEWGAEAVVVNGVVTQVLDQRTVAVGQHNLAIPADGVVLSGHGTARTWLLANAKSGAAVTLPSGIAPEPEVPVIDLSKEVAYIRAKAAELRTIAAELDATASTIESKAEAQ